MLEDANPLAGLSKADRDAYRLDDSSFDYGDRAEPSVTKPAESLPAKPAEQVASTDASPKTDSEPVKTKTEQRFQELLAERAAARERADALERELRELRGKTSPAKSDALSDSSPARPKFETLEQWLAKHPTASPDDYLDARFEFNDQQKRAAEKEQADYDAFAASVKTSVEQFGERIKTDVGDVAAFVGTLPPILADLKPTWQLAPGEVVKPHHLVATEIMKSPIPGKLLTYLRDHTPEFLAILNAGDGPAIVRAMGRLEGKLEAGQSTATPKEPPKLTTSAPPPPKVVSQRPAEPADPKRAAIDSGDYAAFKALEDAEDAARFARKR